MTKTGEVIDLSRQMENEAAVTSRKIADKSHNSTDLVVAAVRNAFENFGIKQQS